jgi:four helix bundle protein
MEKIRNFRDLQIWQLGKELGLTTYQLTREYPKSEIFGLSSQMRRAAVSIAANIAEGFNRFHNNEYRQFLYIALGSCAELETHIEISRDLGYLDQSAAKALLDKRDQESRMIRNLIKHLHLTRPASRATLH